MADERIFTPSQSKAIEHHGSDLLISAGAGSGKTATLTERISRRIIDGADISRMLVVTFTKEASSELKARITNNLAKRLSKDPTNEHLSSQIVKISSADISTIDSFCYKLVKPNFDKLGLDSDFRIGNENELKLLEFEAMSEVIEDFFESEAENEDFLIVADCFSALSNEDVLKENLIVLYEKLSNTADFLKTLLQPVSLGEDFMKTIYSEPLKKKTSELLYHYKAIYEELLKLTNTNEDSKAKFSNSLSYDLGFIIAICEALPICSYSELCRLFDTFSPIAIGRGKVSSVDVEEINEVRTKFKAQIKDLKKKYFSSSESAINSAILQNARICTAIYNVLSKFHEEYRKKKAQLSICTFGDISRYALKLLYCENGELSEIARELSLQYDEIYIDEYQDTNSVQDKIFEAISRNNRFMVGDIKQSIYKFRYAEPEIFSHYRRAFSDLDDENAKSDTGRSIFMSENFRCDKSIIDFTNLVSDYMFFNSDGIPYEKKDNLIFAKKVEGIEACEPVEIVLLDKGESDEEDEEEENENGRLQAEYVAKRICELLKNGEASGREIKKSDIAILLRSTKSKAQPYIDALEKYGVSSSYKAEVCFFEKPHILLILSILNIIDSPYKDGYLAGALCSDIFGFSLDDLIRIKKESSVKNEPLYSSLLSYKGELREKIDSFISRLEKYRKDVKKMSSCEVISYIINESGILSYTALNERQDLLKLYNIAREYEVRSFKGLYKFLCFVEGSLNSSIKEESSSFDGDSVQIMTIHASKGLEFEYCFICGLEGEISKGARESLVFDRNLGVAGHIGRKDGIVKFNTLMRKCVSLAHLRSLKEEEMRILYVGMTRARHKLFITAELKKPLERLNNIRRTSKYVSNHTMYSVSKRIDYILGACASESDCFKISVVSPEGEESVVEGLLLGKESRFSDYEAREYVSTLKSRFAFKYPYSHLSSVPSKMSISKLYPRILDGLENDEIDVIKPLSLSPKFLLDSPEAKANERGTATHVFMQFCDFEGLLKNGYESELKRLVDGSFISYEASKIVNEEHIKKFISSPLFDEIRNAKMIKREFRFNLILDASEFSSDIRLEGEKILVQGVCDCILENSDGELVLIDYKTDNVNEKNYTEVLKERHSLQLSYYKKACEMMFERPIDKVIIYSVPLAKNVEL